MISTAAVDDRLDRMATLLAGFEASGDPKRYFLATYRRTTEAVRAALAAGAFHDPPWAERWTAAFADLYVEALTADVPAKPWQEAFAAPPEQLPLRHVLLGINAHINYDLPQALLSVVRDDELDDPEAVAARKADHERIDHVLASRVPAENRDLVTVTGGQRLIDRVLTPANRLATKRFLREARQKVWANAWTLSCARRAGPEAYTQRLRELEELSARRVADLLEPGQVVLRLARDGFGVLLEPPDPMRSFDPVRLGEAERDAWVAYYLRRWVPALRAFLVMVGEGFGMGWPSTAYGAWLVLRANRAWAPYPDNDPERAVACMRRFYGLVRRAHGYGFDPATAARLDVAWWRVHREAQHDPSVSAETLVTALAAYSAYLYGVDPGVVRGSAAHRAAAMRASDAWVADGCDPSSPLVEEERAELVHAYGALVAAVRCRR